MNDKEFVTALLPHPLIQSLERYIREEPPPGRNRSEGLRDAFKEWCIARGYVRPEDLA